VAKTPDKEVRGDRPPDVVQPEASNRVPAILVSLSALAVIGAATANALPNFSLPNFSHVSLSNLSLPSFSLPNFNGFSLPSFDRFAVQSPHETASVPIPDPAVTAALKDIQSSEQQNTAILVSLNQSSAIQQADVKKISRQLASLAAQVDNLQGAVAPLTTSSIPTIRARVVRTSRKPIPSLPKPVGPVSVGGAPLSPAPASRAG